MNLADVFHPNDRLLAACSGGPDSVALLYALKEIEPTLNLKIFVAHINHCLRGKEADGDQRFVRLLAKRLEWPCLSRKISPKPVGGGNLEEWARLRRYENLIDLAEKNKCSYVVTGHNLDDQVETILMNIFRGAGPTGMAGMPLMRQWPGTKVKICRPMLHVSKDEILGYLRNVGGEFRVDRMNHDPKFLRFWLRRRLIPQIEARFPGLRKRIANLAEIIRQEEGYWVREVNKMTRRVLSRARGGQFLDWALFCRYPLPLQRRFLKQVIGPDLLSFEGLEKLRKWMSSPPSNGRIWQLKNRWFVERMSKSKGAPSARIFWVGCDGKEKELQMRHSKRMKNR